MNCAVEWETVEYWFYFVQELKKSVGLSPGFVCVMLFLCAVSLALLRFTPNGTLWVVLAWQLISLQTDCDVRVIIVQDS